MIILIDQDGVLADFDTGFYRVWRERYPNKEHVPPAERSTFYVPDEYPAEYKEEVKSIYHAAGFFKHLPVIAGAVEAVEEIEARGHAIFFCTSPMMSNPTCMREKVQWLQEYFGRDCSDRFIITKDKTAIHADILIDDRPEIEGKLRPIWEHVLFDRPYNQNKIDKRRITWSSWREVLTEL